MLSGGNFGLSDLSEPITSAKKLKVEGITFTEEDECGVLYPHNDAVVVNFNVANFDVHRILVDNGSSTNILFYFIFFRMGLASNMLKRLGTSLVDFSISTILVEGAITLSVEMEIVLQMARE